jgi:hypothetical protein
MNSARFVPKGRHVRPAGTAAADRRQSAGGRGHALRLVQFADTGDPGWAAGTTAYLADGIRASSR